MDERLARQALNEGLLREVNERVAALDRRAGAGWAAGVQELFEFHCECGTTPACEGSVSLTLAEYAAVREQNDRFVVVPGHETPAVERAVERTDRYVLVDKLDEFEPFVGADDSPGDR